MILDDAGHDAGRDPADPTPDPARGTAPPPRSADDVSDAFDPRFDPAFQRGYQPAPGERVRRRVRSQADADAPFRRPSAGTAPAPSAPAARSRAIDTADDIDEQQHLARDPIDVAFGSAALDDLDGAAAPSPGLDEFSADDARRDSSAARPSILDGLDVSPRRNPYFLTLWLIGGGFVVLGIVLYVVSVFTSYTSSPTASQDVTTLVFSQVGWMLAGPLITVGLATIVALVVLSALVSRRTTDDARPER